MAQDDPLFWTGTARYSGHTVLAFAPLEGNDSAGKKRWAVVGLRAKSGLMDVGIVTGPGSTIGGVEPSEGGAMAQELARDFGNAAHTEGHTGSGLRDWVGEKLGISKTAAEVGVSFQTALTGKARAQALAAFPEDRALAFGALVRQHPNVAPFVNAFEGSARAVDIRQPGVVDAINVANGAQIEPDGRMVRNPVAAGVWRQMADKTPGAVALLEGAAQKGRLHTIGAVSSPDQAFGRLAEAHAGSHLHGETRDNAVAWARALSGPKVDPDNRALLMEVIKPLAQRPVTHEEPGPEYWMQTGSGRYPRMESLSAVMRAAVEMDAFSDPLVVRDVDMGLGLRPQVIRSTGQVAVPGVLTRAPAADIERHGERLLNLGLGRNPVAVVRQRVEEEVVLPMTRRQADPEWKSRRLVNGGTESEEHAQKGLIGFSNIRMVPAQLSHAIDALDRMKRGDLAKAEQVLFPHDKDRPLAERAVVPSARPLTVEASRATPSRAPVSLDD